MASTDDIETITAFAEKNEADFPVLSDDDGSVADSYGVLSAAGYASRWTFYIDRDGKIAHIDKRVSPLTAGQDIARRLESMGVPARAPSAAAPPG